MSTENTVENAQQPQAAEAQSLDLSVEIERLRADLNTAEEKAKQNWDLMVRTKADADNLVKRAERNAENAAKFAVEKLAGEMLNVLDALDQGLAQQVEGEAAKAVYAGLELVQRQTLATLEKHGVQVISAQGQSFNPDLHEALVAQPNADVAPNTVLMVVQKGYTLHGRLLRPARVIVSRAP